MTDRRQPLPPAGVRHFTWCDPGPYTQHALCIASYDWNGEPVNCGCECHK